MNYENRGESEGSHSGQNFGGSHQNHRAGSREHANGQVSCNLIVSILIPV